jgi:hypothetical protein
VQLSVSPISVSQRALSIDTSAIGLSVSPTAGTAGSFGSVLTNVATQLNAGDSLQSVLAGLSATDSATLMAGLRDLINNTLAQVTTQKAVSDASGQPGKFGTLDLSFGPTTLMVDGQSVAVDDGAGGPITVTITAGTAQGHLLDNLFHKLSNAIQSGNASAEAHLLASITQRIDLIEGIKIG